MHIPDGFFNGVTSAGAGVAAAGGLGVALKQAQAQLRERHIPLAGLVAAFVFVLQMINFPVLPGVSGHLLGGALAAIMMGPAVGVVVVTVVVVIQAFLFADGGVSALGLNVINMAVVTTLAGWVTYRLVRIPLRPTRRSVLGAAFVASVVSVVASAAAFVAEYAVGGVGGVDLTAVGLLMVGVHVLIGLGEAAITVGVVGAVLSTRPDLVYGARDLDSASAAGRLSNRRFVLVAAAVAVALVGLATVASSNPDGLEWVAQQTGFATDATESVTAESPLADYGAGGLGSGAGTIVAGLAGLVVVSGVGALTLAATRRRRQAH